MVTQTEIHSEGTVQDIIQDSIEIYNRIDIWNNLKCTKLHRKHEFLIPKYLLNEYYNTIIVTEYLLYKQYSIGEIIKYIFIFLSERSCIKYIYTKHLLETTQINLK